MTKYIENKSLWFNSVNPDRTEVSLMGPDGGVVIITSQTASDAARQAAEWAKERGWVFDNQKSRDSIDEAQRRNG